MGVIHEAAALEEEEVPAARAIGLPVLDRAKPGFALPCPFLVERSCSIYEQRPQVCGRYKCRLLQNVEAGEITLEDALGTVATAHEALAQATEAIPPGMSFAAAAVMVRSGALADDSIGSLSPAQRLKLMLHVTALGQFLDRHFRNDRDGELFTSAPLVPELMDRDQQ